MTDLEINRLNAGAPDLKRQQNDMEQQIRSEVEKELGHLSPTAREAVIQSRIGVLKGTDLSKLVKVDLGPNASKKIKDTLFE
jgi:DNA-directed RNA polymerase specialized sigma24 family protein